MSALSRPTLHPLDGAQATRLRPVQDPCAGTRPLAEVVVPVYNEEPTLDVSVRRLHGFLHDNFPFSWQIVIADNASTDRTFEIARGLADELDGVVALHLPERGRGRALRAAWSASHARVLCYMDVDLSTDLQALLPLVAPLVSGHSDLAIGTRLGQGSRVTRSPKRELISRAYNLLLRTALGARFSDAQCGFKAIRADVARELVPRVRDEEWFFDTELLVLAQRAGLRIHEVAVDWIEDPDSRVAIISTAAADLRGVVRLLSTRRVVLEGVEGRPARALALAVLVLASALATTARHHLGLRYRVFAPHKFPTAERPLS